MGERRDFVRHVAVELWKGYASHGGLGMDPGKVVEAAWALADYLGIPPEPAAIAELAVAEAHVKAVREGRQLTRADAHRMAVDRVAMEVEREARHAGHAPLQAGDAHQAAISILKCLT